MSPRKLLKLKWTPESIPTAWGLTNGYPEQTFFQSTCECPKNWILDTDDSTCIPDPNLISVECSSNSMKVELNELIFDGFLASQISLAFNESSGTVS